MEEWLMHNGGVWAYLGVLLVLVAASLGLPLPEDIPLLIGGYLVHVGAARLWLMILIGMIGVLSGDFILFTLGRTLGHRIVQHRFLKRIVNQRRLLMAEGLFGRHGTKIIFAGRFLPGLRPMIFMAAGVLKVPFWLFAGVNGFAACISVPVLITLGYVFGESYEHIKGEVRSVTHYAVLAGLVALMIAGAVYLHRRQRRLIGTAELPADAAEPEEASWSGRPGSTEPPAARPHAPPATEGESGSR